eukprot:Amastigsp_a775_3252.p4 type:complete len:164 gc:universal Amastigsp_a775_3252:158-649(+)
MSSHSSMSMAGTFWPRKIHTPEIWRLFSVPVMSIEAKAYLRVLLMRWNMPPTRLDALKGTVSSLLYLYWQKYIEKPAASKCDHSHGIASVRVSVFEYCFFHCSRSKFEAARPVNSSVLGARSAAAASSSASSMADLAGAALALGASFFLSSLGAAAAAALDAS